MIDITNLSKTYPGGVQALRHVSLAIGPGLFGLVGPNGAGKTTLMRTLAGLVQPSDGRVCIFGHDVTDPAGRLAVKAGLGYLPQELGLYPNLSAFEFLDYLALLKGIYPAGPRRRQVEEVLDQVRLTDVAHRPLKTYSGGMKPWWVLPRPCSASPVWSSWTNRPWGWTRKNGSACATCWRTWPAAAR